MNAVKRHNSISEMTVLADLKMKYCNHKCHKKASGCPISMEFKKYSKVQQKCIKWCPKCNGVVIIGITGKSEYSGGLITIYGCNKKPACYDISYACDCPAGIEKVKLGIRSYANDGDDRCYIQRIQERINRRSSENQ